MPAREFPMVSEEDMRCILSARNLHHSWVVPLMEAYSRGLICHRNGSVVLYYEGLDEPIHNLLLSLSGSATYPFYEPREEHPWDLESTI